MLYASRIVLFSLCVIGLVAIDIWFLLEVKQGGMFGPPVPTWGFVAMVVPFLLILTPPLWLLIVAHILTPALYMDLFHPVTQTLPE